MDVKSFKKAQIVMSEIGNLKEVLYFFVNCEKNSVKLTDGDITVYIDKCGANAIGIFEKEIKKLIASKEKEFAAIK